jgi:hypothetical protein
MLPLLFKILLSAVALFTAFYGTVHFDTIFSTISAPTYTSTIAISLPAPAPTFKHDELPVNNSHNTRTIPRVAVTSGETYNRSGYVSDCSIHDDNCTVGGLAYESTDARSWFWDLIFNLTSLRWPEFVPRLSFTQVVIGLIIPVLYLFRHAIFGFTKRMVDKELVDRVLESLQKEREEERKKDTEVLDTQFAIHVRGCADENATRVHDVSARVNSHDVTIGRLNARVRPFNKRVIELEKNSEIVKEKLKGQAGDISCQNARIDDLLAEDAKNKECIAALKKHVEARDALISTLTSQNGDENVTSDLKSKLELQDKNITDHGKLIKTQLANHNFQGRKVDYLLREDLKNKKATTDLRKVIFDLTSKLEAQDETNKAQNTDMSQMNLTVADLGKELASEKIKRQEAQGGQEDAIESLHKAVVHENTQLRKKVETLETALKTTQVQHLGKMEALETTLKALLERLEDPALTDKSKHGSDKDDGNRKPGDSDGGSPDTDDKSNDVQPQLKPVSTTEQSGKEARDRGASEANHTSSAAPENKTLPDEVEQLTANFQKLQLPVQVEELELTSEPTVVVVAAKSSDTVSSFVDEPQLVEQEAGNDQFASKADSPCPAYLSPVAITTQPAIISQKVSTTAIAVSSTKPTKDAPAVIPISSSVPHPDSSHVNTRRKLVPKSRMSLKTTGPSVTPEWKDFTMLPGWPQSREEPATGKDGSVIQGPQVSRSEATIEDKSGRKSTFQLLFDAVVSNKSGSKTAQLPASALGLSSSPSEVGTQQSPSEQKKDTKAIKRSENGGSKEKDEPTIAMEDGSSHDRAPCSKDEVKGSRPPNQGQSGANSNDEDDGDDDNAKPLAPSNPILVAAPTASNEVAIAPETAASTGVIRTTFAFNRESLPPPTVESWRASASFQIDFGGPPVPAALSTTTVPSTGAAPSTTAPSTGAPDQQARIHIDGDGSNPTGAKPTPAVIPSQSKPEVKPKASAATKELQYGHKRLQAGRINTLVKESNGTLTEKEAEKLLLSAEWSLERARKLFRERRKPENDKDSSGPNGNAGEAITSQRSPRILGGVPTTATTSSMGPVIFPTTSNIFNGFPTPSTLLDFTPQLSPGRSANAPTIASGDREGSGEGRKVEEIQNEDSQEEADKKEEEEKKKEEEEEEEKKKEEEEEKKKKEEKDKTPKSSPPNPKKDPDNDPGAGSNGNPGDNDQDDDDHLTHPSNPVASGERSSTGEGKTPSTKTRLQSEPSSSRNCTSTFLGQYEQDAINATASDNSTSLMPDDKQEGGQKATDDSSPPAVVLPLPTPPNESAIAVRVPDALAILRRPQPTSPPPIINGNAAPSGNQPEARPSPMERLPANVLDELSSGFGNISLEPNVGSSEDMHFLYGGEGQASVAGRAEELGEIQMEDTSLSHGGNSSGEQPGDAPMRDVAGSHERDTYGEAPRDATMEGTVGNHEGDTSGEELRDTDMKDPSVFWQPGDIPEMRWNEGASFGSFMDMLDNGQPLLPLPIDTTSMPGNPPPEVSSIPGLSLLGGNRNNLHADHAFDFNSPPLMTPMNGPTPSNIEFTGRNNEQTGNGKTAKECNCCPGPRHVGSIPPKENFEIASVYNAGLDPGNGGRNLVVMRDEDIDHMLQKSEENVEFPSMCNAGFDPSDCGYQADMGGGDIDISDIFETPGGDFECRSTHYGRLHPGSGSSHQAVNDPDQPMYGHLSKSGYPDPLLSSPSFHNGRMEQNSPFSPPYRNENFLIHPRKHQPSHLDEQEQFASSGRSMASRYGRPGFVSSQSLGSSSNTYGTRSSTSLRSRLEGLDAAVGNSRQTEDGTGYAIESSSFTPFAGSSSGTEVDDWNIDLALRDTPVALPFSTVPSIGVVGVSENDIEESEQGQTQAEDASYESTPQTTPEEHRSAHSEDRSTTATRQSSQPSEQLSARTSVSEELNDTVMRVKLPRGELHPAVPSVRGKRQKDDSTEAVGEEGVKRLKTEEDKPKV